MEIKLIVRDTDGPPLLVETLNVDEKNLSTTQDLREDLAKHAGRVLKTDYMGAHVAIDDGGLQLEALEPEQPIEHSGELVAHRDEV